MRLRLDWATHDAAVYACRTWHYSRSVPAGKMVHVGVWEDDVYKGVILYSRGAAIHIGSPFGLDQTQVCELTRVALRAHATPVSRMLAISLRMLKKHCPGLRLVVSYADSHQGHHGGIYQASGWLFIGDSSAAYFRVHGKLIHPKTLHSRYGLGGQSIPWLRKNVDPNVERVDSEPKHKYVYPLDDEMRRRLLPLSKPYPKRQLRADSIPSNVAGFQPAEGGSTPTSALHTDVVAPDEGVA